MSQNFFNLDYSDLTEARSVHYTLSELSPALQRMAYIGIAFGVLLVAILLVSGNFQLAYVALTMLAVAGGYVVYYVTYALTALRRKDTTGEESFKAFARRNSLRYSKVQAAEDETGPLFFSAGTSKRFLHVAYEGTFATRSFLVGTYYMQVDGNDDLTNFYRVAMARLPEDAPHIILDYRRFGDRLWREDTPVAPKGTTEVVLEGDFPRFYRTYCAPGHVAHREMLRILTPDVMAYILDNLKTFSIEMYRDELIVYAKEPMEYDAQSVRTIAEGVIGLKEQVEAQIKPRPAGSDSPRYITAERQIPRRRLTRRQMAVVAIVGYFLLQAVWVIAAYVVESIR